MALGVADSQRLLRYQVLQPEYSIYDRAAFDDKLKKFASEKILVLLLTIVWYLVF